MLRGLLLKKPIKVSRTFRTWEPPTCRRGMIGREQRNVIKLSCTIPLNSRLKDQQGAMNSNRMGKPTPDTLRFAIVNIDVHFRSMNIVINDKLSVFWKEMFHFQVYV